MSIALIIDSSLTNRAFRAINGFTPWKARELELPSAVGFTSSKSLARLYYELAVAYNKKSSSSIYNDGSTIQSALEPVTSGLDNVLLDTDSIGTRGGWWRHSASGGAFYHGGFGNHHSYRSTLVERWHSLALLDE
jgi:hypothetical protein